MNWSPWMSAAALGLGGGIAGAFGGGSRPKPYDPDPERHARRMVNHAAIGLAYPGVDFGYRVPEGLASMPYLRYSETVPGTHRVQQQAIDALSGFDPMTMGQDIYGRATTAADAFTASAGGALADAYNRLNRNGNIDISGFAGYARGVAGNQAQNPYMDAMVEAANRDAVLGLARSRGAANAASSGTGNIGSSRHAVANAISDQMAANRMADVGAEMRGAAYQNAYNQAYGMAGQIAGLNQADQLARAQALSGMGTDLAGLGKGYFDTGVRGLEMGSGRELDRARLLGAMGESERNIEQELKTAREQERLAREMGQMSMLEWLRGMQTPAPGAGGTMPGSPNTLGNMIGGLAGGLSLYDWIRRQGWFGGGGDFGLGGGMMGGPSRGPSYGGYSFA